MRVINKIQGKRKYLLGVLTLALAMCVGLLFDGFSFVSYAQSQGKVTASSAKIRKEASATSEVVGSAANGKTITINHQVTGADGYTWYETFVDANTKGYIRSDLVEITDGTTPPSVTQVEPTTGGTTTTEASASGVEKVNPVAASVKGTPRVRSAASTKGDNIIMQVSDGLAVTVIGQTTGSDNKTWYQVTFNQNGKEITGFIRSDYVNVSGDLTPYVEKVEAPAETEEPTEATEPEVEKPAAVKDYDTAYMDGEWYLIDNMNSTKLKIQDLTDAVSKNAEAYEKEHKKVKAQKAGIIVCVMLLVAAIAAIAFLVFKIRDLNEEAEIALAEREAARRREGARPTRPQGAAQRPAGNGEGARPARPQGAAQRPTGNGEGARPARPQGAAQRPAGNGEGQRPARPQGAAQRPAGNGEGQRTARPQGAAQRPAGNGEGQRTVRPQGTAQRPAGNGEGVRPQGAAQRPAGNGEGQRSARPQNAEGQRPVGAAHPQRPSGESKPQRPTSQGPKNFMEDDDDFEFSFLNGEEDDE